MRAKPHNFASPGKYSCFSTDASLAWLPVEQYEFLYALPRPKNNSPKIVPLQLEASEVVWSLVAWVGRLDPQKIIWSMFVTPECSSIVWTHFWLGLWSDVLVSRPHSAKNGPRETLMDYDEFYNDLCSFLFMSCVSQQKWAAKQARPVFGCFWLPDLKQTLNDRCRDG